MGDSAGSMIFATIGQLLAALQGMAGTFSGLGMTFLSLAVILTLFSGIYTWWLSGSIQDLVANGVRMLIVIAPLLILFNGWGDYMKTFQGFFYNELPAHLGMTGGSPEAIVGQSVQKVMDAVKFPETTAGSEDQSWWGSLSDAFSMKTLYSLVLTTLVFILNVLLIFAMIFAVFMPVAGLYIGAIFGPLVLAWLPWKPLADMGARWTGFMIANGITFVVALVIIKALGTTVAAISAQLAGMADDGLMSGMAGYAVSLVALLAIYIFAVNLLLQANNMAQGMTGGATVGEGLFGKLAAAGAGASMLAAGRAGLAGHAKAGGAIGKATASAPGAAGKAMDAGGKSVQGAGVAAGVSNMAGATGVVRAGNAMRAAGGALKTVQGGIDKAGSLLGKGADRVKSSGVAKELSKPVNSSFRVGGGGAGGDMQSQIKGDAARVDKAAKTGGDPIASADKTSRPGNK